MVLKYRESRTDFIPSWTNLACAEFPSPLSAKNLRRFAWAVSILAREFGDMREGEFTPISSHKEGFLSLEELSS